MKSSSIAIFLLMLMLAVPNAMAQGPSANNSGLVFFESRWYPSMMSVSSEVRSTGIPELPSGVPNDKYPTEKKYDYRTELYFFYETKIRNGTGKAILSIAWDHIFIDRASGALVGRIPLAYADKKIGNGQTVKLAKARRTPPTRTIDAHDSKPDLLQRIELKCLVFADKTRWLAEGVATEQCVDTKPKKRGYFN